MVVIPEAWDGEQDGVQKLRPRSCCELIPPSSLRRPLHDSKRRSFQRSFLLWGQYFAMKHWTGSICLNSTKSKESSLTRMRIFLISKHISGPSMPKWGIPMCDCDRGISHMWNRRSKSMSGTQKRNNGLSWVVQAFFVRKPSNRCSGRIFPFLPGVWEWAGLLLESLGLLIFVI